MQQEERGEPTEAPLQRQPMPFLEQNMGNQAPSRKSPGGRSSRKSSRKSPGLSEREESWALHQLFWLLAPQTIICSKLTQPILNFLSE